MSCSYAVDDAGALYAWGFGENQQLGTGSDEDALVPTLMSAKALQGCAVKEVRTHATHNTRTTHAHAIARALRNTQVFTGGQHTLFVATVPAGAASE